ncbi:glycosyltransferase [Candidatus Parcubacteria bacterium]|nr:glycosyltransferase [Candidatus Parcubacteria bacterium]
MKNIENKKILFLTDSVSKPLLLVNILLAGLYFLLISFWFPKGNIYLFTLLILGEIYHVWQISTYIHTIWGVGPKHRFSSKFEERVDVFITVAGEPVEIVEETVRAVKAMAYPHFNAYILNDGYVAKKENWQEIEELAKRLGVFCITRTIPGGAKAGNINHALARTNSPYVAVFDADHVPYPNFLDKMMGYFVDSQVGFVQSPQYYKNHDKNYITQGAWEQQELFFGTICPGKDRLNATFMCGTNMVIRRSTLEEVGGICDKNITEDFLTSQFIHEKGWKSIYVSEVLAEGLAPEDMQSYCKQQFRWARGSLELIFKYNPLFRKGLTWNQKIQYLSASSYWLSGLVVLMNALFPVIFFFTGAIPFQVSTMLLALIFLPYIFLTVYILRRSTGYRYTYRAVSFSMAAFMIHIQAAIAALFGLKNTFTITSKKGIEGRFIRLIIPHALYVAFVIIGLVIAIMREGLNASVASNFSWALFNIAVFIPFMIAVVPELEAFLKTTPPLEDSQYAEMRKNN